MKQALTVEAQIALLKERGMSFEDEKKAEEILLDIGFYRLGFYSFPFESTFPKLENRSHLFLENTTFNNIVELYYFDYDLRKILLNVLNRIEINIRTRITYIVSNHYSKSTTWFANPGVMKSTYIQTFDNTVYKTIADNPIIKRHHSKYINDRYAPAWKTLEFMTLGNIYCLYLNLKDKEIQALIAQQYKCSIGVFINYLETIRTIRNKCAHGSCIYNINLAKGIKSKPANISSCNRHNISGIINVIQYILGQISSNRLNDLNNELQTLLNKQRSNQTTEIIARCTNLQTLFQG